MEPSNKTTAIEVRANGVPAVFETRISMFDFIKRAISRPKNPTADLGLIIHEQLVIDFDQSKLNSISMKSGIEGVKGLGRASGSGMNPITATLDYLESGFSLTFEHNELVIVKTYLTNPSSTPSMRTLGNVTVIKNGEPVEIRKETSFGQLCKGLGDPDDGYDFEDDFAFLCWTVEKRSLHIEYDRNEGVDSVEFIVDD